MSDLTEQTSRDASVPTVEQLQATYAQAELDFTADWVEAHGDPADWAPETHSRYENTIREIRAGGAA
jgi:hypothetical protein